MCGNKVMMLFIPDENIYFFDSYSFLHMKLSAIPKAMGISNLCKGFHPYFFYDLDYEGVIVDKIFFDIDNMDEKPKN